MPLHSIDALLDPAADAAVRAEWAALSGAGVPSRGDHRGATNAPHLTVVAASELTTATDPVLGPRLADLLPVPLRLGGLVDLGGSRRTLARAVQPTPELLALHRAVVEALSPGAGLAQWSLPPHWLPHVTLSGRLDPGQLATARRVLGEVSRLEAQVVAVRRWDPGTRSVHPLAP